MRWWQEGRGGYSVGIEEKQREILGENKIDRVKR